MSDFKIVKCKKCDAALVELAGETLDRCEQCGYNFVLVKNTSVVLQNATTNEKFRSEIKENYSVVVPEVTQMIRRIRKKVTEQTKQKATSKTPEKKKSWIVTMLKWYFIIAFIIGTLTGIFSD